MEYSPKDLVKIHNLDRIKWTYSDLGVLLKLGLLKGTRIQRKGITYIDEESLLQLLEFYNGVIESKKFNTNAVTGTQ